jgi:DNA-binding NtrC family response regulator
MSSEQPSLKNYRGSITVIDDEENMCKILNRVLNLEGYHVMTFTDPRRALDYTIQYDPDIVLTDIKMPELSGMDVLQQVKRHDPNIVVIMITAFGTIEGAIEAMKAGAFHYVTKPFNTDELLATLEKAIEHKRLSDENRSFSEHLSREYAKADIIGECEEMVKIKALIEKIAPTDSAVLIRGETGTGKELVAKAIHRASPRRSRRFVPINCASIPDTLIESELFGYERGAFTGAAQTKIGLIELAHGGTLFLDEIGDLPLHLQAKILRVLQEHEIQRLGGVRLIPVDIRLIAATNQDLQAAMESGAFRRDLFYRLNVINIFLPPLRERADDIYSLIEHFLNRYGQKMRKPHLRIQPDAVRALRDYPWPGNVRELENIIERIVVLLEGDEIRVEDIPSDILVPSEIGEEMALPSARDLSSSKADYRAARQQFETEYIIELLRKTRGNVAEAARLSGISRRNLYEKIERCGIDINSLKTQP